MTEDTQPNDPAPDGADTQSQVIRPSIDQYERIVDRAHTEIEAVRTVYKWLLAMIAIIVVVGIYFSYQSMRDFKAEIIAEGEKLKAQLTQESTTLNSRLQKDIQDSLNEEVKQIRSDLIKQVDELSRTVKDRVEKEFQSANVSTLIRDRAISRVEEIADPLIEKEIETKLSPRIKTAEDRIASLDEEIGKARGTRDDLRVRSEFTTTVIFAQNDDRQAFDKLKTWSDDANFPFKDEAQQAWMKILDEHATPFALSGFTVPWTEGVDPANISFERLKASFQSAPAFVRVGLVEYIWKKRQDISKKDKMEFLVEVMKSDKNLSVVEYAGRFFAGESKQKIKPLATDVLLDWWGKNKADYEKAQQKDAPDKK